MEPADIASAQYELDRYYFDGPERATPRPPATSDDLTALASHLGANALSFPPSYRDFRFLERILELVRDQLSRERL